MDLRKTGKFIAERRKAHKITQEKLAEMLNVSDRAVSKWERGICMPGTAAMPGLCDILEISINELFCGERIEMKDNKKTEQALLEIAKMKEQSDKRLLNLEVAVGAAMIVMFVPSIIILAAADMENWVRESLICILTAFVVVVAFLLVKIEQIAGYYECKECHHKYVPTYWTTNLAPHMGRTRYMKCPKCGKKSWQKKVLK